jgi:hypothetical protein
MAQKMRVKHILEITDIDACNKYLKLGWDYLNTVGIAHVHEGTDHGHWVHIVGWRALGDPEFPPGTFADPSVPKMPPAPLPEFDLE